MHKLLALALTLSIGGIYAQEAGPATPPAAVLKAFKTKEKKSGDVVWTHEGTTWIARFSFFVKDERASRSMTFTEKGKWTETVSTVSGPTTSVLPKAVTKAAFKKYAAEAKIAEADVIGPMLNIRIVETPKGITYVQTVKDDSGVEKTFKFNKAGKEIK